MGCGDCGIGCLLLFYFGGVCLGREGIDGALTHIPALDRERFQDQFQLQLATQQQRHRDDIEALWADQRRSGPAPSAVDEASANRRSTFFSGHEHNAGDVESLLNPCLSSDASDVLGDL